MDQPALYDRDILAWTEEQAAALRALADRRDLPNALDLPNVIEEIEALGRSELKAATSPIRRILGHLIKLALLPDAPATSHWIGEISNWYWDVQDSLSPSMHQRVDPNRLWRRAMADAGRATGELAGGAFDRLPDECPLTLKAFLAEDFDLDAAIARIQAAAGLTPPAPTPR